MHEVDVAERIQVIGPDGLHLRTRTRRSACAHPALLYPRCSISRTVGLCRTSRGAPKERNRGRSSQRSLRSFASQRSAPSRSSPRRDLARSRPRRPLIAPNRPRPPLDPRPLSTIPAPPRVHPFPRASPLAGQQADDDIFVQPQLLHVHAALLLDRMQRGAEHLVAGVFEYYSWMPQVAASNA